MCCRNNVTKMTTNASSAAKVDAVEFGGGAAVVVFPDSVRHTKLLSWSLPLGVNVTKLTLSPAT